VTAFFDKLEREAREGLHAAIVAETEAVSRVLAISGDVAFPDDLRDQVTGAIALYQLAEQGIENAGHRHWERTGSSLLIDRLHGAFHKLVRRRVMSRFGLLGDDPAEMAQRRDQWDARRFGAGRIS